jgi:hypothetical protein
MGDLLADSCPLVSASDLTNLTFFQVENLSKLDIKSAPEPDKT